MPTHEDRLVPLVDERQKVCRADWGGGIDEQWEAPGSSGAGYNVKAGGWCTSDGRRVYGYSGDGQAGKQDLPLGFKTKQGSGGFHANAGEDGAEFDAGFNWLEAGWESPDDFSPDRDDDDAMSLSFGFGPSIPGGGFHVSDRDHDGHNEYTIKGSYGPFSGSYTTERPVHDAAQYMRGGPANFINRKFTNGVIDSAFGRDSMVGDAAKFVAGGGPVGWALNKATDGIVDLFMGGDDAMAPAEANRAAQGQYDELVKAGMDPEVAETTAGMVSPGWKKQRGLDRLTEEMVQNLVKAGMSPADAEMNAGTMNPVWQQQRESDRIYQGLYDVNLKAGMTPEVALALTQALNPDWRGPRK